MTIPLGGDNAYYLDLYTRYLRDRNSVPADWIAYFAEMDPSRTSANHSLLMQEFLATLRRFGHLEARLDPLAATTTQEPQLTRLRNGLSQYACEQVEISLAGEPQQMSVEKAVGHLYDIYCGPIGLDVAHLDKQEERDWWHAAFEAAMLSPADQNTLGDALDSVVLADEFEAFMRVKFPTKKRFGSEGSEGSIVFVREIVRSAPKEAISEIVMGGMHRGRLALLAVALGKSLAALAAELMGRDLSEGAEFTGDVPYHLGYCADIDSDDSPLRLTLLPHPSHLLVVAPVALGLARATGKTYSSRQAALPLLLHTDAAFAGQGLSSELMQLGGLEGYSAGGTVHLVVNNQIGFTTLPSEGRSSRYCTDGGKAVGLPVLHVNGDDPVSVIRAARLALAWRQRFGKDVLIDLVCYRRYGHNELDEPRFTQPGMWERIDQHPPLREHFEAKAVAAFPELKQRAEDTAEQFRERLRSGFDASTHFVPNDVPVQRGAWADIHKASEAVLLEPVLTGLPLPVLRKVGLATSTIPDSISANPKVGRFYEQRAASLTSGTGINFATAEALAISTLLAEGIGVRLSGQDSVRGTFTQRHLAVHDAPTGRSMAPVCAEAPTPQSVEIINSPLSEYAVLGFEYGHSLHAPNQLTLWEAQFGDFLNGAQIVVDQYIVSAEVKWQLRSGIVVLLPHGLEGQGPDHSSARIERLAQLCAGANILIANPSTPANLFHLLRRQIHASWRKPLFVIAPKSLLRLKAAVSALEDMGPGSSFRPVISELRDPSKVQRIALCSGKFFYAAEQAVQEARLEEKIVLIRVEQIYPFPVAEVAASIAPYQQAEIVWLQEEPANQGAWPYASGALAAAGIRLAAKPLISRPALAVPAGGSVERHEREQAALLAELLTV